MILPASMTATLALLFATGAAHAASAERIPPTPVQDVIVIAPKDPKVVATFPADGASIASGTVVIKIVFDQPMTPEAWAYDRAKTGVFPDCLARPRLLPDKRTFVLLCSLAADQSFAMKINGAPGFVSAAYRAVPPFQIRFSTTDASTLSLHDALQQAGLTDADDPIMDWDGASGVSNAQPVRTPQP